MLELIEAFNIFAKYNTDTYCLGAEHEQIWVYVDDTAIPVDSDDGIRLAELGWFVDEECWSRFV